MNEYLLLIFVIIVINRKQNIEENKNIVDGLYSQYGAGRSVGRYQIYSLRLYPSL